MVNYYGIGSTVYLMGSVLFASAPFLEEHAALTNIAGNFSFVLGSVIFVYDSLLNPRH